MEKLMDNIWLKIRQAHHMYGNNDIELVFNCSVELYITLRAHLIGEYSININPYTGEMDRVFGIPVLPSTSLKNEEWIVTMKI